MTIDELFDEFCAIEDEQARFEFACANPMLISSQILPAFAKQIEKEDEASGGDRFQYVIEADGFRQSIARALSRYPIGSGPFERIVPRVERGEISFDAARELVTDPDFAPQLAPVYTGALAWHAQQTVASGKDLSTALLWVRLLAAACHAVSIEGKVDENLRSATVDFIQIAGVVLGPLPDGEVLHDANELGNEVVDRLEASEQPQFAGDVLHALGCLYTDPLTSTSSAGTRPVDHAVWVASVEKRLGPALAKPHLERFPLPKPPEALDIAIAYFERALNYRQDAGRGVTLKALLQTLIVRDRAAEVALDLDHLQKLGKEALTLLDSEPYHRDAVINLLRGLGTTVAGQSPVGGAVGETPDAILQQVSAQHLEDPAGALRLLFESEALFMAAVSDGQRHTRLQRMLVLIPQVYAQGATIDEELTPRDAIPIIAERGTSEGWSETQIAALALGVAMRSGRTDDELFGLQLLGFVTNQAPELAAYEQAIGFAYATLNVDAAVNAVRAENPVEAIRLYAAGIAPYLRLNLESHALQTLERISDLAAHPHEEMALTVVLGVAFVAIEIEKTLGDAGAQALQRIYQRTCASLPDSPKSNALSMLMQLAKGVRFAAMMQRGTPYIWQEDETATALLQEIEALEQQVDVLDTFPRLDDILLSSAVSNIRAVGGADAVDRLYNLQAAFDSHISDQTVSSAHFGTIIQPEALQSALGNRTVLVDYFLGEMQNDQLAVYMMVYSSEGVAAFRNVVVDKNAWYVIDQKDSQAAFDVLGLITHKVRGALQLEPEAGHLHPDAEAELTRNFEWLIGTPTWAYLEELRAQGKDHLCICPYGALRYYPLHLLGPGDQDLARRWIVTFVPSLECVLPRQDPTREIPGMAFGLDYQGGEPFGLEELESAHAEVTAVADLFGTPPILDAEVTEPAVLDALTSATRVHLCAHGSHDASAPMFQSLYLTPIDNTDGRLRAYELLGLDLKGLEIVTLGVCDSSLGRFDAGDNLRGLPAALLCAGAATLITSLWEARDETAELFFVKFYRALEAGESRLDAFGKAQKAAREAFPEPRDWAAFSYLGRWDTGVDELPHGLEPYLKIVE